MTNQIRRPGFKKNENNDDRMYQYSIFRFRKYNLMLVLSLRCWDRTHDKILDLPGDIL